MSDRAALLVHLPNWLVLPPVAQGAADSRRQSQCDEALRSRKQKQTGDKINMEKLLPV
jgi:hypothetical protein